MTKQEVIKAVAQAVRTAHPDRNVSVVMVETVLDALGDVAEPTNLVLRGAPASDEMAAYLPRLTRVLEDAAAENRNVELTR